MRFLNKTIIWIFILSILQTTASCKPDDSEVIIDEPVEEEEQITKGKKGTFFGLVWFSYIKEPQDNLYAMYRDEKRDVQAGDIPSLASQMKARMQQLPAGKRAYMIHEITKLMNVGAQTIYLDEGVELLRERVEELFTRYKNLGGPDLDYLAVDWEDNQQPWGLKAKVDNLDISYKEYFDQIINDPRYQTEVRPKLEALGFDFGTDPGKNELSSLYESPLTPYSAGIKNLAIWSIVSRERISEYLTRAIFEPTQRHFPNVKTSNYHYLEIPQGSIAGFDGNGINITDYGAFHKVGTHSNVPTYGYIGNMFNYPPRGYQFSTFQKTPFNSMLRELIKVQTMYLNTEGNKISAWIAWPSYSGNNKSVVSGYAGSKYYNEWFFHLGLCNPDPLLIFINHQSSEYTTYYNNEDKRMSDLLYELDDLAGFDNRRPLIDEVESINTRYLLSGMSAGGRNVWRLTPDLYCPDITMENFLVDEDPLTFQIGNQVIRFPEESFIYTPKNTNSTLGYWIISPEGSIPVRSLDSGSKPAPEPVYDPDQAWRDIWNERTGN